MTARFATNRIKLASPESVRMRFRSFLETEMWASAYKSMHVTKRQVFLANIVFRAIGEGERMNRVNHGARIRGYANKERQREYRRLGEVGVPIVVKLLIGNHHASNDPHSTILGMGIGCFDDPELVSYTSENDWIDRAESARASRSSSTEIASYQSFRSNEEYLYGSRHLVPPSLSGKQHAYLFHINVVPEFVSFILNTYIVCLAEPGGSGVITAIPSSVYSEETCDETGEGDQEEINPE
ncbi:MAG: hypothetical protein JJ974_11705 [Phycisphaerales bacterium]|nr:hypothetical protein [Phycisphaerales bacterium]